MELAVFYDLLSQPSRALVLFLKLNKIPFIENAVNLTQGQHFTEEYKDINPFRKVPVIKHGDFVLTESVAILKYLADQFGTAEHWYPKDPQKRAKVNEYLAWQHLNTRGSASMYFRSKFLDPKLAGTEVDERKAKHFEKRLKQTLKEIENYFLKDNPFICGQDLTIADLLCACELEQPRSIGFDVFDGHPKLKIWHNRVRQLTSPHYDQVHKNIYEVQQLFSKL